MHRPYTPRERRLLAIAMAFPTVGALIGIAGAFRWVELQVLIPGIVLLDVVLMAFLLSEATRRADPAAMDAG